VRDISAMGAMPGMELIEPADERQVARALRWAVEEARGPAYIRLVSVPWELEFELPDAPLEPGRGTVVREGGDGTLIAAGPVMLSQAWAAVDLLAEAGAEFGLIALPWLRDVDGAWLAEVAGAAPLVCIDNHYLDGGQGDAVLRALADCGASLDVVRLGVTRVPVCGDNLDVLREHGLNAAGIATRARAALAARA
jgi:transketolase